MQWTQRTEKALYRAAQLHDGQYRKGKMHLPALVHLVAVASIVSEYTKEEDIVVAALLHDSLEDTVYTDDELSSEFGLRVAAMVRGTSIPDMRNGVETGEWGRDRQRYFETLRAAPAESILIAAADKFHNFSSVVEDYGRDPDGFRSDFSGTKEDRLRVYGAIATLLVDRLGSTHPLSARLQGAWESYAAFVEKVLP